MLHQYLLLQSQPLLTRSKYSHLNTMYEIVATVIAAAAPAIKSNLVRIEKNPMELIFATNLYSCN
jgi:hypothetical protein